MTFPLRTLVLSLALGGTLLHSGVAQAQVSFNSNSGLNGNPTLGDAPGWPITIGVPGSYRLTSNIITNGDHTAIHITVDGVTLDLNGHMILGPVSCSASGDTVQCAGPTSGHTYGVKSSGNYTVVRNGYIRGFGAGGVNVKSGIVENLHVESNHGPGISVGQNLGSVHTSRVSGVTSTLNWGHGLHAYRALVDRTTLSSNLVGLGGDSFSLIDSLVTDNKLYGLVNFGTNALQYGSMKGTVIRSINGQPIHGTVHSMGGNVVDGVAF